MADVNQQYINAVISGDILKVKHTHRNGADINRQSGVAIIYACQKGCLDILKYIIENGADTFGYNASYALSSAVRNNHMETLKYLLRFRKNSELDKDHERILKAAASSGHVIFMKYLIPHGIDITMENNYALRWACKGGHLEFVKFLHEHGVDLKFNNNEAIQLAASRGNIELVKYLYENGADITARGKNPMEIAEEKGHKHLVKYINEVYRAEGI